MSKGRETAPLRTNMRKSSANRNTQHKPPGPTTQIRIGTIKASNRFQ